MNYAEFATNDPEGFVKSLQFDECHHIPFIGDDGYIYADTNEVNPIRHRVGFVGVFTEGDAIVTLFIHSIVVKGE